MRKLTLLIILVATAAVALPQQMQMPKASGPQSDAQKAFEKLKTLAGSWEGTVMGIPINFTIRAASSGTAILHEGNTEKGVPNHEITMFYVEGDRLLATHYCDAGNRPRMTGKMSPDGKTVKFEFLDVAGSTQYGHMHHAIFTFVDANHHIEDWTFMLAGDKPVHAHFDLQRTK